jgi:hypothetical protein
MTSGLQKWKPSKLVPNFGVHGTLVLDIGRGVVLHRLHSFQHIYLKCSSVKCSLSCPPGALCISVELAAVFR